MYKKIIIVTSLLIQLLIGWFLLTAIVFADSHANLLELITYFVLAIIPYGVVLALYSRQQNIKQSILISLVLYFLSAVILTLLPLIKHFYITGVGGVGLTSISVMSVHAVILLLTISALNKKEGDWKILTKQIPIVILCFVVTIFLLGFFITFARDIEPDSYVALGYLNIKEVLSTISYSMLFGLLTVFLNLKILFIFVAYTLILVGLLYLNKKKSKQPVAFGKKVAMFFIPIWICMGIYATTHQQAIRQALVHNFANFQAVWDHRALIQPYTVELDGNSVMIWCDSEPQTKDQSVICKNRFEVTLANKPVEIDENVYPKMTEVGLFEPIPLYSDARRSCIYTKNSVLINNTLFKVTTERCNQRNYSVLAGLEWDEFILPLLECFGIENCKISKSRY